MELFKASKQWSTRPEDEKFFTIESAYAAAKAYAAIAHEKSDVPMSSLRVEAQDGELTLVGRGNVPANLTNWAFGQIAQKAGAPAGYLRKLPATLAAQNVNHGLASNFPKHAQGEDEDKANILVQANGHLLVRSLNSDKYSRIWNYELLERLRNFPQYGWETPVPFFNGKGEKGKNEPTIYVSDHDMFVFLANYEKRIVVPGKPDGLSKGFFVENSEVGASRWRVTAFLFDYMCANHIVWGASQVSEISVRHVGSARDRMGALMSQMEVQLNQWADDSTSEDSAKIVKAMNLTLGADKDEVIDAVFSKLRGATSRDVLEAGYDMSARFLTDGSPNTAWGLAGGMTRYSQTLSYADARVAVDRAAAKVIELAF